jgi:hypothetical protein
MKTWHWIALLGVGAYFLLRPRSADAAMLSAQAKLDRELVIQNCHDACYKQYAGGAINEARLQTCVTACGAHYPQG